MTSSPDQRPYAHAATIFQLSDVARSIRFYCEKLEFELGFSWEEPPTYAVLAHGEHIAVHLSKSEWEISPSMMYVFVHKVDEVYKRCHRNQVRIHAEIGDREYGMRDFGIVDPDGNRITFGQSLEYMDG